MRVVHVARCKRGRPELSIHTDKWIRLFAHVHPAAEQQVIHPDRIGVVTLAPAVVVLHALNLRPWMEREAAQAWPDACRVGLSYNDLWTSDRIDGPEVRAALDRCHISFGCLPPDYPTPPARFRPMLPLVDATIFRHSDALAPRDIPILLPTGFNGRDVYWRTEARRALQGLEGVVVCNGRHAPEQMADLYRRARVALVLREYLQPSYAIVEAALCGCSLVVSDTPGLRAVLAATGAAALVPRDAGSIRAALESLVRLGDEARAQAAVRAREALAGWTLQAQAEGIVRAIMEAREMVEARP